MSTTTQILFNSPALHSLKRDQLVKLCKIHSIKASGKNTELIKKLRKHAETLPRNDPLSIAARSEELNEDEGDGDEALTMQEGQAAEHGPSQSANARWGFQLPRPSEQWEVVMDKIEEAEEGSSQGTLNSLRRVGSNSGTGEFGTDLSKSSNVSSSLKSIASSFGLKRGNMPPTSSSPFPPSSSKSALYFSSLPGTGTLGQTSHDTEMPPEIDDLTSISMQGIETTHSTAAPLPGHSLRPGMPAPDNARLSLGLNSPATPTRNQPTTTIRLISNPMSNHSTYGRTPQLKPFKTSFELEFGSPQPNVESRIYPPLPLEELMPSSNKDSTPSFSNHPVTDSMDLEGPSPGSLVPAPKRSAPSLLTPAPQSTTTAQLAAIDPFVFGSPLPQHNVSNTQFKNAATSVLEEMNKRLQQEGVNSVGMDLISKLKPGTHAQGVDILGPREAKEAPKTNFFKEKFDELHAAEFSKMEGIDSLVKRRGLLPKPEAVLTAKKRKSSVAVGRDRFGRRVAGETGRLSAARVVGERRRSIRVIPGSFGDEESDAEEGVVEEGAKSAKSFTMPETKDAEAEKARGEEEAAAELEERKQKEKEAIRRNLEMNKAKRRSSVGVAGARGRVSVGRGGVILKPQPAPKPSRFGFLSSAKSLVQKVWGGGKAAAPATPKVAAKLSKPIPAPASVPALKKVPARPSSAAPSIGKARADKGNITATMSSTTSTSTRPRLPSFAPTPSIQSSLVTASRVSAGTGTGASVKSGMSVSSLGTRTSLASTARSSSSGAVGSMGSKRLPPDSGSRSSIAASASGSSTFRLSSKPSFSRLLAPTASSLAKMNRSSVSGSKSSLKNVTEGAGAGTQATKSHNSEGEALGAITNSKKPGEPWSPRRGPIFSKPLTVPSGMPTTPKMRPATSGTANDKKCQAESNAEATTTTAGVPPIRQRSINGRKPRISRSKVIAKLASQRAAGATGLAPPGGTPGAKASRMRSSLGVKAQRSSFGGKPVSTKGTRDGVLMSAKKRVRQSEYARRKSRVAPIDFSGGAGPSAMDVDAH
ncbi:hypothetical protein H0H87_002125 [Tephrocybe sp. NHM501043]|nr:hypothetical protein H0H87_002125 [Tephrocybe sp. NHM501043]